MKTTYPAQPSPTSVPSPNRFGDNSDPRCNRTMIDAGFLIGRIRQAVKGPGTAHEKIKKIKEILA